MRGTDLAEAQAPTAGVGLAATQHRSSGTARCQVAVIGAGPYGLAAGAHLHAAGISTCVFGEPMGFWRRHMPEGMKLRHATGIAEQPSSTLESFLDTHGIAERDPLPIEDFLAYAEWFQHQAVPQVDRRKVLRIGKSGNGFALRLEDGSAVEADRVVVALGLKNQEYRPPEFAGLPQTLVSHSCEHASLARFRGSRVAVIGRGQSACESAVLLGEAGAQAEIVCRGPIHWIGSETPGHESGLKWRLHQLLTPKFVIGPFPLNWFATFPGLLRRAPYGLRGRIAARCLRPAATAWLRPRAGSVRVRAGCSVVAAEPKGTGVSLQLSDGHAVFVDHVLLATGYRVDIDRYDILTSKLAERVERVGGYPVLNAGFESSVPGLHFVGACAAGSFGPMLRFVVGTGYAARALADAVTSQR